MIKFEELRNKADECLDVAKKTLIKEKAISPFIIGVSEDGTLVYHDIEIDTQEKIKEIPGFLNEMAWIYSAVIVVINLYVYEADKDTDVGDIEEHLKHLEDHPDTSSALFCFIYTKKKAISRQFRYDPDTFNFYHYGKWKMLKEDKSGLFNNPFDKIYLMEVI